MGSSRTGSADSNKRLPSTLTLEIFPRVDTWEYYVIALDEGDIEKLPQTPVTAKALRWIDMRQRDGKYLAARRQLAEQQGKLQGVKVR